MNDDIDPNDPLEAELSDLRPCGLSDGFVERLSRRLEQPTPHKSKWHTSRFSQIRLFATATAIALSVGAAVWLVRSQYFRQGLLPPDRAVAVGDVEPRDELAQFSPDPTLLSYNRLIGGMESDLDDLLDHHAMKLLPDVAGPVSMKQPWP